MILFIGGAPRVGKTQITKNLAKKLGISHCSTDDLRWGAKQLDQIPREDPLFTTDRMKSHIHDMSKYLKYTTKEIIDAQNTESKEVIKVIKGFIESVIFNKEDFILEGVALTPEFVTQDFIDTYKINFFCIGNTDYESFIEASWINRTHGDWLEKTDKETFSKVIYYCAEFSRQLKEQANKRGLPYFEINSINFEKSIEKVVDSIIETTK